MAKKKPSSTAATAPMKNKESAPAEMKKESPAPPRDPSPEKNESLKTLNSILLKETVERREQVSQLNSRIEELSFDESFLSDCERDFTNLVLSDLVLNLRSEMSKKIRVLESEKEEAMEKGRDLQLKVESLTEEVKMEMEKVRLAETERLSVLYKLDLKGKEVNELRAVIKNLEGKRCEIEEKLCKVCEERDALLREGKEKDGAICNLWKEKGEIENKLEECNKLVESFKVKIGEAVKEKEERVNLLNREREALESVKSELELNLRKVCEERDGLVREGREKDGMISNLQNEKGEIEKSLGECKDLVGSFKIKFETEVKEKEERVNLLKSEKEDLDAKIRALEMEHEKEIDELNLQIEGLKRGNDERESEIGELKAVIDSKIEKIEGLNGEVEILQLAVEQEKKKGGFWSWIYPAATTVLAAISFVYATRAR